MADHRTEAAALMRQLDELLADSLGAWPHHLARFARVAPGMSITGTPAFHGWRTTILFALITIGGAALVSGGSVQTHILWLLIWGAPYLGWAVFSAKRTTGRVLKLIGDDIVPMLSASTIASISKQLRERFSSRRVGIVSWGVSLLGLAGATAAIYADLYRVGPGSLSSPEIKRMVELGLVRFDPALVYPALPQQLVFWALGWLAIFFTASRCTDVARFYEIFAEQLANEEARIYPLDPSSSVLIKAVAALGRTMLAFWVGISLSILLLMPLFFGGPLGLPWAGMSRFGWLVIPFSLSFSLGFSTFVFLKSEGAIRRVVASVTRRTLLAIEEEIAPLLAQGNAIESTDRERLKDLVERHDAVARAASYKSFFLQGLSLIPLISTAALTAKALYEIFK